MNDKQYRAFLDLMMCSDPWPVLDQGCGDGQPELNALADSEAAKRGFEDWIEAYHKFVVPQ